MASKMVVGMAERLVVDLAFFGEKRSVGRKALKKVE